MSNVCYKNADGELTIMGSDEFVMVCLDHPYIKRLIAHLTPELICLNGPAPEQPAVEPETGQVGSEEDEPSRDTATDHDRDAFHNMFRTAQLAEEELMRQKSRRPSFVPETGKRVWVVELSGFISSTLWAPTSSLHALYRLGRVHLSMEDAEVWRGIYQGFWDQEVPGNA